MGLGEFSRVIPREYKKSKENFSAKIISKNLYKFAVQAANFLGSTLA